ncbi:MAG: carbohydrate binding family 9 domain-containing protein [bacterium]|nr:carbohydrate binding family 9 domain-containing protein [bacterium]
MPLLVTILVLFLSCTAFADMAGYEITAKKRTSPITLDGRLERVWLEGGKADNFIQREPGYPAPVTQKCEVYVLYDENALYFGYMYYDTAPDSIAGQIQRRDNDSNSDFLDLYLDTFHDHRTGYWFTVTAAGVQAEGTFFSENNLSNSWDAVWESAVAITDSGWSCELRIPFQIMRHGGSREDGWGVSFARKLYRINEAGFWPPVDPEIGWKASKIATLRGLDDIASSAHLEVLPHAVGRWDAPTTKDFRSENEWENLGLTLKYVPSAALSIDGAYQPDFAQVDVDEAVINLSDYPVFLSEKRPFFLESKEYFEETPYTFVYTRRVADPDYGGRVNYQKGNVKASFLAGKNRLSYFDDQFETRGLLQDVFVGRTTLNSGRHRFGLTGTYLNQTGYTAAAAGFDAKFRWRVRDQLNLWLSAVDRSGDPVQHWYRVAQVRDEQPVESRVGYVRDYGPFRSELAAAYRGTDYDINDLGWGDPSNQIRQALWIGDNYYLNGTAFRNFGFDINSLRSSLTTGDAPEGYANFNLFTTTRTNWELGGGMEWGDDFRRRYVGLQAGEFRDNFGSFNHEYYKYFWHWGWFWSDQTKPFRYGTDARYRTFRDGNSYSLEPEVSWRPRSNIELGAEMDWTRVWNSRSFVDDSGHVVTADFRNWILKSSWSPSLKLSFRGTLQWIEKSHFVDDQGLFFANLLMSYNWSPGSWFYIVYDESGRDIDRLDHADMSIPGDRTLRAKLTYFFTVP